MNQFFTPLKGCRILASDLHPFKKEFDYIGEVLKVDGSICFFRNRAGDTESVIWKFKEGNNKYIYFGA